MNDRSKTCDDWAEAVSLMAADCLSADEAVEVREHLDRCPTCQQRFEQLVAVCGGLEASGPLAPSAGETIVARMMAEIERRPALDRRMPRRWGIGVSLAVAASLLVAVGVRVFLSLDRKSPEPILATAERSASPATLLAYQRAFGESDEAFDRLLAIDGERLASLSTDEAPLAWMKEFTP
jgi:hypothetical protein